MQTVNLHIPKAGFPRLAAKAAQVSRNLRVIVNFTVGGRKFTMSPKKSLHTLLWERELQQLSKR